MTTRGAMLFLVACGFLAGCREAGAPPLPVTLGPEAVGYFCQMNILDHGGPKAQVHLDTYPGRPLFFSQVRDAVIYLRMPERDGAVQAAYMTDMGSSDWDQPAKAAWVAAKDAVFVVGSSRKGGMDQPEFVPFAQPAAAEAFIRNYGGQAMRLADIPDALLDAEAATGTAAGTAAGTGTGEPAATLDDADYTARLKSLSKPETP